MQLKEIKYMLSMNQDSDPKSLDSKYVISKTNLRYYKPGSMGVNVPVDGTELIESYPDHKLVGWCKDIEGKSIVMFLAPSNPANQSKIIRYNINDNTVDEIVSDKDLNLKTEQIVEADIVGDMLYWTDGYFNSYVNNDFNPPRKINIKKALNIGHNVPDIEKYSAIYPEILSVSKKNIGQLTALYDNDLSINRNFLREKLFQFRIQYVFDDNERGAWSNISNMPLPTGESNPIGIYGRPENENNRIKIYFDSGNECVKSINFAVREGNTGHWRRFKTVDKYDADGNIINILSYVYYYGNEITYPLDDVEVARLFHDVPVVSKKQRFIDGKNMLYANYLTGYNNADGVSIEHLINYDEITYNIERHNAINALNDWLILAMEVFEVSSFDGGLISAYLTYHNDEETFERSFFYTVRNGDTLNDIAWVIANWFNESLEPETLATGWAETISIPINWTKDNVAFTTDSFSMTFSSLFNTEKTFKSGSAIEVGVVYYDDYGRCGGVQGTKMIKIPFLTEYLNYKVCPIPTSYRSKIDLDVSGVPPDWARYYSFVVSPKQRRYFQFLVDEFTRDKVNGFVHIRINDAIQEGLVNNSKVNYGYYTFNKGDRIRILGRLTGEDETTFVFSDKVYDMEIVDEKWDIDTSDDMSSSSYKTDDSIGDNQAFIVDEKGNKVKKETSQYLCVKDFDFEFDHYDADKVLIEVYSPELIDDTNNVFYEIGQIQSIQNPHKPNRTHAVSQTIYGDSYVRPRVRNGIYFFMVEDTNFSDIYTSDYYSQGRPNIEIENAKQRWAISAMKHSKQYFRESYNGLSDYNSSEIVLNERFGEIRNMAEVGYILKVIQDVKTTSVYIGRTVIDQADGTTGYVGYTDKLLGTVVPSTLDYGTIFTKSIVNVNNYQYFFDVYNGTMVREAQNGPFPISKYGLTGYFKEKAKQILDNIDRSEVVCGWDGQYDELTVTFNINGVRETVVFHEPENSWAFMATYRPDGYAWLGDRVLAFYDNKLWRLNSELSDTIFGGAREISITVPVNSEPLKNKIFQNIVLKGSNALNVESYIYDDGGNLVMQSALNDTDFVKKQDSYWANFKRNGTTAYELINGSRLIGRWMKLVINANPQDINNISYMIINSILSEKS